MTDCAPFGLTRRLATPDIAPVEAQSRAWSRAPSTPECGLHNCFAVSEADMNAGHLDWHTTVFSATTIAWPGLSAKGVVSDVSGPPFPGQVLSGTAKRAKGRAWPCDNHAVQHQRSGQKLIPPFRPRSRLSLHQTGALGDGTRPPPPPLSLMGVPASHVSLLRLATAEGPERGVMSLCAASLSCLARSLGPAKQSWGRSSCRDYSCWPRSSRLHASCAHRCV